MPQVVSPKSKQPKFIFVTGGVLSGLGKGTVSASIGLLLKSRGFRVTAVKIDPYVSIDAGTMRPAEHGEVFVTDDGGEIDQDIGHYERFLDLNLSQDNNITTGKVFQRVINDERHFVYQGRDVEMIPDVIDAIKLMIRQPSRGFDFVIVEIGGTSGDLENMPFLHAAREIGKESPSIYIMVTYLPFLRNVGELKTKPTQHAVARLREIGIVPDFIVTRNEIPIDKPRVETIAKRCFIAEDCIIDDPDVDLVHRVPLLFDEKQVAEKILDKFGVERRGKKDLKAWRRFIANLEGAKDEVRVALVGKYVTHGADKHQDVYISVLESLRHAASFCRLKPVIVPIDSSVLKEKGLKLLQEADGIIVPQGWGSRGTEGKILAAQYAREKGIPYLGLCFGMQMAVIEFGRHVLGLKRANSTEVNRRTPNPVIHVMPDQKKYLARHQYGGTIRLGAWKCRVLPRTRLAAIYGRAGVISERHRHRYEFNNRFRTRFEKAGMKVSGVSPDKKLVEAVELPDHPFFIGVQFHPEYRSRPLKPHPLFVGFLYACYNRRGYGAHGKD